MGMIAKVLGRLRRRPVDPERALARAQADAHRRAIREQGRGGPFGSGGGIGDVGF
jgi:hypothetical protein